MRLVEGWMNEAEKTQTQNRELLHMMGQLVENNTKVTQMKKVNYLEKTTEFTPCVAETIYFVAKATQCVEYRFVIV